MIAGHATSEGAGRLAAEFPQAAQSRFYAAAQGLLVSTLGLGTYLGAADEATDHAYREAVLTAVRGGLNVLDTAINYRGQRSERALGAALRQLSAEGVPRDQLLVCTKAGFLTPGAVPEGLRAEEIAGGMHCLAPAFLADQVERSRANLELETLDVFYLHNPETQLRFVSREVFEERVRAAFMRLEGLAAEGKISYYGMATWGGFRQRIGAPEALSLPRMVELARQAGGDEHRFRFIQLPVNLALPEAFTWPHASDRQGAAISVLEAAVRAGITVVASASLMQARLAQGLPEKVARALAGAQTDAQRALQFTRSTPGVSVALAGMSNAAHVRENLGLTAFPPADLDAYLSVFGKED